MTIPPGGARLGRSSRNDIVLDDPSLSRHHCRVYFKPGQGLWVTDLASANGTLVNGKGIQDTRVAAGDTITVGDTSLQVLSDQMQPDAALVISNSEPVVDLGLSKPANPPPTPPRILGRFPLLVIACLVTALAVAAWVPKFLRRPVRPPPVTQQSSEAQDLTLSIDYEKIEATATNIFRYHLLLTPAGALSVQMDSLSNNRHVRKEKRVEKKVIDELAEELLRLKLFALAEEYVGVQPDILDSWDLSATIGRRTHRVRVVNRIEPESFQQIRERIEGFGKDQLSLHPVQISTEKLLEWANKSYLLGKKLFDERDVKYGNLSEAIKRYDEAEWYLESIEPKPDYYKDVITGRNECKSELQTRYEDHNFRAQRAMRLRDWQEARRALNAIKEMVPDRADPRHEAARKDLIEVERGIRTKA